MGIGAERCSQHAVLDIGHAGLRQLRDVSEYQKIFDGCHVVRYGAHDQADGRNATLRVVFDGHLAA